MPTSLSRHIITTVQNFNRIETNNIEAAAHQKEQHSSTAGAAAAAAAAAVEAVQLSSSSSGGSGRKQFIVFWRRKVETDANTCVILSIFSSISDLV